MLGALHGRYNFKYETIDVSYDKLPPALEGLTIVHLSDLHLKSFRRHPHRMQMVVDSINAIEPDIIVNTGDFVTYLFDELEPFAEILGELKAKYGVYAVPGNHDTGLYSGRYDKGNYGVHLDIIGDILRKANHIYLDDTTEYISIDTACLALTGVVTYGSVPDLYYGDLDRAISSTDTADFRILLTHDPNHWLADVQGRNDIDLSLSGHTHGMQMGILAKRFKLSPASLLYPAWNGLYGGNGNYLYVNRGLGTLGMPARIGMPPEITVITLKDKCSGES